MTVALTLRLPDEIHERLRREAFDKRTSVTALIIDALTATKQPTANGCDVCGEPHVMVSTPGAIRFCAEHRPAS